MNRTQALLIAVFLVLAAAAVSVWFYPHLPTRVPTHWDLVGNPNGFSTKLWGAALMPVIMSLLLLLLLVLPVISPKGFRLDRFMGAFDAVIVGIIAAMLVLNIIILCNAVVAGPRPNNLILLPVGIIFIVVGNYMEKFRKNFFIGVRTPWTLASDEVWARTHRLAGRLFVLGGLALMASSLAGPNAAVFIVILSIVIIVPAVYSFLVYWRIEGFVQNGADDHQ